MYDHMIYSRVFLLIGGGITLLVVVGLVIAVIANMRRK